MIVSHDDVDQISINWWALLTDTRFLENPYPELKRLQQLGPVHFDCASGVYFILGHREFGLVSRSPQMGRDTRLWRDGWCSAENKLRDPVSYELFSEFQPQMINMNPPDHGRMRSVYQQAFKPSAVAAMIPMIEKEADQLLENMCSHEHIDLISSFAGPLPLRVLRNLFEISPDMDDDIQRWSAALIKIGDIMMTQEQKVEALAALSQFKEFLRGNLARRRRNRGTGMIDSVIEAFEQGFLDEQETLTNLVSMLVAGHETTVTLIGNGMLALMHHPAQMRRLRAEPALVNTAVDEFLRYEPGGNMILRVAIEDFILNDMTIPAGSLVVGLVGAINRDPARFTQPDVLDIARNPNPHFTYGGGIHICIGAPLAHLEAKIAFDHLLKRFPDIAIDGDHVWRLDRLNARGLQTLPVRLGAAA